MTSATWVLPVTNQNAAERCIGSLHESIKDKLLVVDNSREGLTSWPEGGYQRYRDPVKANYGVAASWEKGRLLMEARGDDFLVLLSQSITFGAKQGLDFVEAMQNPACIWGCESKLGWKLIGLTWKSFVTVGGFDTHYEGGYFEDSHWIRRARLRGVRSFRNHHGWVYNDIDATSEGDAQAFKRGDVDDNLERNRQRYLTIWGGPPGKELFTTEYNLDGTSECELDA